MCRPADMQELPNLSKRRLFGNLTYLEYCKLSPNIQDEYLDWSQWLFEIEWKRIQFERQGGIEGLAKKKAGQEVDYLNRVTTWSYLHAYIPQNRCSNKYKCLIDSEMFRSSNVQNYALF